MISKIIAFMKLNQLTVRNPNVSLSPTFNKNKNEKVKQYKKEDS